MAKITEMDADLSIISKLGNYPGAEDGLSPEEFKAKFDEAGIILQTYINRTLVPAVNDLVPPTGGYLGLSGGKMEGKLDMSGNQLTGLATPTNDKDAVPKSYALCRTGDSMAGTLNMANNKLTGLPAPAANGDAATKAYVDAKIAKFTATVPTFGWTTWNDGANTFGYVDIAISGILATDEPDVDYNGEVNSSSTIIYRHLEWWNSVYKVSTKADAIRIFATEVPTEEIPIKLKVVR